MFSTYRQNFVVGTRKWVCATEQPKHFILISILKNTLNLRSNGYEELKRRKKTYRCMASNDEFYICFQVFKVRFCLQSIAESHTVIFDIPGKLICAVYSGIFSIALYKILFPSHHFKSVTTVASVLINNQFSCIIEKQYTWLYIEVKSMQRQELKQSEPKYSPLNQKTRNN